MYIFGTVLRYHEVKGEIIRLDGAEGIKKRSCIYSKNISANFVVSRTKECNQFVKKHAGDAKICILCIDTSNSTFWKKYWWCWQVVPVYIKKEIKPDFCDTIIFYIKWLGMIQHFPDWVTGMDIKCQAIWQQRSRKQPIKRAREYGFKEFAFLVFPVRHFSWKLVFFCMDTRQ